MRGTQRSTKTQNNFKKRVGKNERQKDDESESGDSPVNENLGVIRRLRVQLWTDQRAFHEDPEYWKTIKPSVRTTKEITPYLPSR